MNELQKILKSFDILGVPYFSDYTTIKTSFRKKIKELHPDIIKTKDDEEAKKLISSYKFLQSLYNNKDLLEHYRNQFLETQNLKTQKRFISLPSLKSIKALIKKHYKLIIKVIALAAIIIISTIIFDNLINITLFIMVVVGGYFAFTRL
jgi:curved DNA-binding protein CbpA